MIDRLIDHTPDFEQEIYEDQLSHITKGILIRKDLIKMSGTKEAKNCLDDKLIMEHSIRGQVGFDQDRCFFKLDKIFVEKYDEQYFLVKLEEKGIDRIKAEKSGNIFDSDLVIAHSRKIMVVYLENLTIESFVQMGWLRIFKMIGIDDPFFDKISSENYQFFENDFLLRLKSIGSQRLFRLVLPEVYLYYTRMSVSNDAIDFDFNGFDKLKKSKNSWTNSEIIKI